MDGLITKAFNYRGDVTLELHDGCEVECYVFSRDPEQKRIRVYVKDDPHPREFQYSEIRNVRFTGEDTAFGKSWEEWKTKRSG